MATTYDIQHSREPDADTLGSSAEKASNNEFNLNDNGQMLDKKHKTSRPFNRDFIDSLFTVVNKDLLYCKLFYFFFFGAFGSLFPLLAIYFKQLGMNASQSGVLIGFRPFIEFLSAPFWGGLADKWRRGKEMLLFSLLCWIVFTLAIAFVQPPAHKCLTFNGTHNLLEFPVGRSRRYAKTNVVSIFDQSYHTGSAPESAVHSLDIHGSNRQRLIEYASKYDPIPNKASLSDSPSHTHHSTSKIIQDNEESSQANILTRHDFSRDGHLTAIVLPKDLTSFYVESRCKRSRATVDTSKIANINGTNIHGLVFNPHSSVVYQEDEVARAFFILLLLVVIGEFFSAPSIIFADSVTLSFLGDDTQNYGRQRMFGSLGWGLAMFFVGMALDHSTTFPDHPCGKAHISEKNYTVCFAVFSVLMSCAFLAAMQFRFDHHRRDNGASEVPGNIKDKVKKIFSSRKKIDKERLVEEYSDEENTDGQKGEGRAGSDEDVEKGAAGSNLKINPAVKHDMVTDALRAPNSKNVDVPGALPFGSAEASYSNQPFFGKWIAVVKLLATYKYISVLFIAWFMGFGIGIIFTFLFWHLQDMGGSPTLFGVASVINHISELFAYFMAGSFIGRYGHVKILYAGLLGSIARFMYISFLTNPWWVLPFEFVQGLTHAAVWAGCCAYITHAIPVELRSSAQGILQGLHHGLGRGCGAVFGGLLVYQYGSVVTFRIYGVTCIIVLAAYFGVNVYLERKGKFSHSGRLPQEIADDSAHLAPHGVPSGVARNLSSTSNTQLTGDPQKEYGAMLTESASTVPARGAKDNGEHIDHGSSQDENPMHHMSLGHFRQQVVLNRFRQQNVLNHVGQQTIYNHFRQQKNLNRFHQQNLITHVGQQKKLNRFHQQNLITHVGQQKKLNRFRQQDLLNHFRQQKNLNHFRQQQNLNHVGQQKDLNRFRQQKNIYHVGQRKIYNHCRQQKNINHFRQQKNLDYVGQQKDLNQIQQEISSFSCQ